MRVATAGTDGAPGTVVVGRPARTVVPEPAASVIELAAPPRQAESPAMSGSMGMILVPAASGVGAVLLALTHQDRPLMAAAGLLVLAASIAVGLAMLIGSRTGVRRRTREQRERYLDYLEQLRSTLHQDVDRQRSSGFVLHPDPVDATAMAFRPERRWERRPGDADFLLVRVGLGHVARGRTARVRVDAADPMVAYDPVCLAAARELADDCTELPNQPVCLPFGAAGVTCLVGPPDRVLGLARALLAQLVWAHSPAEVGVLVCRGAEPEAWDWIKWLPHSLAGQQQDGPLPRRLVVDTADGAGDLLNGEAAAAWSTSRRYVVVVDRRAGPSVAGQDEASWTAISRSAGAHVLLLAGPAELNAVDARLVIGPGHPTPAAYPDLIEVLTPAPGRTGSDSPPRMIGTGGSTRCRLDDLDQATASMLARSFAPLRPFDERAIPAAAVVGVPEHLPIGDAAGIDPTRSWRPRHGVELLRAPIGTFSDGEPVILDLKELAAGGMGPHGLIVGATGSGKSELLRTLVISLAIRHPPETLVFLAVDFKGGATFSGLSGLPHLAGMVTNLAGEQGFVDRFRDALGGELQRRQELLAAAGRLPSLTAYRDLRSNRPDLEAVPQLMVIVDEFSELLGARPDLAELFVTVGRIGRSIGVHLLLATQRLDAGRIRGLESHLSYRICLRTFSEAESREAIGGPDAHHLPTAPGWAYLVGDGPVPRRFRVAMVSSRPQPLRSSSMSATVVLPFDLQGGVGRRAVELQARALHGWPPGTGAGPATDGPAADRSPLDIAVDRLAAGAGSLPSGRPARRIWLDPLPERLALDCHLPAGGAAIDDRGHPDSRVSAAIGLIDLPASQRQDPLEWDLTTGNANLLIVGAGRSGKSTALQTILAGLCLRHAPGEVAVLCVDHGGHTLLPWVRLPHVAALASRTEPELTRRIFTRVAELLAERERLFSRHRFGSTADLRSARQHGTIEPSVAGDIVLIIDGWASVRDTHEHLESTLNEILVRGPGLGVHTVLTALAPHQLRTRLAGAFGNRIELRLSDSFDSAIDRSTARTIPHRVPGRALVVGGHLAQLAQPILAPTDDRCIGSPPAGGIDHTIETIRRRWPGPAVPAIRVLPSQLTLQQLRDISVSDAGEGQCLGELILGLAEDTMRPIRWAPLTDEPHLVIYGDAKSGKTTVLRALLHQLTTGMSRSRPVEHPLATDPVDPGTTVAGGCGSDSANAAAGFEVVIIDYRRQLIGSDQENGWTVATTAFDAANRCSDLAARLSRRLAPAGTGRPILLIVDDYDLVATAAGNPLHALLGWLPRSRDLGLHLVVTRRVGGAARAQYEPVLQALADLGTPVLLFSGPSAEGRIGHGSAPVSLPPGRARLTTRDRPPQLIQTPLVAADRPAAPVDTR